MSEKRMPWTKFFPRDWRAAPKLRMCSFAARGLWIDVLSLMAESIPRGFLLIEGRAPTPLQIARLLSASDREVKKLLEELDMNKVFSITGREMPTDVRQLIPANMPDGVILSRRMVRDVAKAKVDADNGRLGGNPRLNGKVNSQLNGGVNPQLKRMVNLPGYASESTNHNLESYGSNNSVVAMRANAPLAFAGNAGRLQLTGATTIWTIRLKGHRPGKNWPAEWGPPPESDEENENLDPYQRREWRLFYGMTQGWGTKE